MGMESVFDREKFNRFVLDHNVVGFFPEPLTLASGRKSHHYVSWRSVAADVYATDRLTDFIISFVLGTGLRPDSFFAVPEGATKIGVLLQYKWAKQSPSYGPGSHDLSMGRGKPKDHGNPKDKYFLGLPRGRTVILEDTTTTGESLLNTARKLSEAGVNVVGAVVLTNRNERRDDGKTVQEAFEEKEIGFHAMSNILDLIPDVFAKVRPGAEIGRSLEEYFSKYGERKLKLQ
ncbi:hypothetical protein C4571_02870 [Candidatus Parcubacteria bacterium]|nr:MAG: hypothetical protein C4571_02870 [Candidatus Parcubacteria bacterium]